jgi:hypothetical protein
MSFQNFNSVTAKKPYTYRRNPVYAQSYIILKQQDDEAVYEPIGDYTVLDQDEDSGLSEKKLMNLIALMNDEEDLIDLKDEVETRLLFHRAPTNDPDKTRIIFYALGRQGVSKENAILTLEEGLEDA